MTTPAVRGLSRVWLFDGGAGPNVVPQYIAYGAAQGLDKNFGDVERIEVPSQVARKEYDAIGEIQSGEENATITIMLRRVLEPSLMLKVARKKCIADIQIHLGNCTDPRDFNAGWESGFVIALEGARITTYSTEELGSLQSDDESPINEEVEFSAREHYEIGPMTFAERAKSEIVQEIIKILVCDSPSCSDCEDPSDGCQKVFAITAPAGSSPGLQPEVVVSDDGFTTVAAESTITTLAIGEDPDDAACVGDNLIVVSQDSLSLHHAPLDDLLAGTASWTEVTTGFVATKGPRAIDNFGPFDVFIAGAGGYIYYSSDPTTSVSVLDAGVATTQDLNDIYAYSAEIVIAVGASNAVIFTTNGSTFQSVTGPAVGVVLNCVFARTEREWWVGTADGKIYYTKNQGQSWTEKTFPGSGTGQVDDILFASNMVGFAAHRNATPAGRILRTISGGHSWYVLPDGSSSLPANDRINSLAVCKRDVNTVFGGGLADNAADGIVLKGETTFA